MSKKVLLSVFAVLALGAAALAGNLEDAQALQKAGDYEAALAKFEAAVDKDGAAAAHQGLSEVLAGLGRYEEAAAASKAGLAKHPDHVGLLMAKARAYMLMADQAMNARMDGNLILAHAADCDLAVKKILEKEPDNADAVVLRAKVIQHQGGQDEALVILNEQATKTPGHFDTQWEIGQHWFRAAGRDNKNQELWATAEKHFRLAVSADPKSGMAVLNATLCAAWQRKPVDVLAVGYEQAAMLLPGNSTALKQLNAALTKRPAERLAAFVRLQEAQPDNVTVTLWYAWILRTSGQVDEAMKVAKAAVRKHPKNGGIVKEVGDCLRAKGDLPKAVAKYEEALELRKGEYVESEYNSILGVAGAPDTPLKLKEKLWTALWTAYPSVLWAPNNAGLYYRDNTRAFDESIKWYLRAVEAAPEDVRVLNDTAVVYLFNLNDAKKAEPFYRRAITAAEDAGISPGNQGPSMGFRDALNGLSKILIEAKRWKDLGAFVEDNVPEGFPGRDRWAKKAKSKGK